MMLTVSILCMVVIKNGLEVLVKDLSRDIITIVIIDCTSRQLVCAASRHFQLGI
jgi:hypothetical protein